MGGVAPSGRRLPSADTHPAVGLLKTLALSRTRLLISLKIVSYAQNFEDVMLWRALQHVEQGFYIDVGAHDPVQDSVSLMFFERGWRGVHVEPSATFANRLRDQRPGDEVLQVMVGGTTGVRPFYEIPETGLSTADVMIADRHKASGYEYTEVACPALTLDSIIGRFDERELHWLKIDVEGSEREVLLGWTLPKPLPWIVLVESTQPMRQTESQHQWEPLLLARGFEFVYFDGLNRFYVSPEHKELKRAFAQPPNVFDGFTLSGTASSSFAEKLNDDVKVARQAAVELELRLRGESSSSQQELERLQRELSTQQDQSRDDRATIESLSARVDALRSETSHLQRQHHIALGAEQEQIKRIQSALTDTTARLHAAAESEARLRADLAGSALRIQQLDDAVEAERNLGRHVRETLDQSIAQVRALESSMSDLKQAHELALLAEQKRLSLMQTSWADAITALRVAQEGELAASRQDAQELALAVASAVTETQRMQADLDGWKAEFGLSRRELARSQAELARTRQELARTGDELTVALANYRSIEQSRSWRITRPFRLSWRFARTAAQSVKSSLRAATNLPRRTIRTLLLTTLASVRANPSRKQWVARLTRHAPALDARLRRFARRHPANTGITPVPATTRSDAIAGGSGDVPHFLQLPPTRERENAVAAAPAPPPNGTGLRDATTRWRLGRRLNV